MKHEPIGLDLRGRISSGHVEWLTTLVDEALVLLRDVLRHDPPPQGPDLGQQLEQCRERLDVNDESRSFAQDVLARCRSAVDMLLQRRAEQRREMASLVTMVHEAVQAVGSEVTAFQSSVTESTTRFEEISELTDPTLMRARLIKEVKVLREVAAERQKAWDATAKTMNERVQGLEKQLVTTKREAETDELTGILNRRTFDRVFVDWMRRPGSQFVLAFIDVDDFKSINDTHGHKAGDLVLVTLAQGLAGSVRSEDVVARIGGDEFAVLLNGLTLRQAETRFNRMISALFPVENGDGLPCRPHVSCGLAEFSAGDTQQSLYERADEAMYAAKRLGKNRVVSRAQAFIRDLRSR